MIHQIKILVWKNLLLRLNHLISFVIEIFLPLGLLMLINTSLSVEEREVFTDPMSFEAFKENECISRHSHYGVIVYEPSTPFIRLLMAMAACYAGYKKSNVKPGSLSNNSYFSIGVKFNMADNYSTPHLLNYTLFPTNKALIRLNKLWRYGTSIPKYSIPTLYPVVELQRAIDSSFLHLKNISSPKIDLENTDLFDRNTKLFWAAILVTLFVAFSLMVPPIISRIVEEKQTGSKELMLLMGVSRWNLWVARFLDSIMFTTLTVFGMVLFLCVPLGSQMNHLEIPPLILWSFLMYGLLGVVFFVFFMSSFFDKPSRAVYVTLVIWGSSFALHGALTSAMEIPLAVQYVMCLLPQVALMEGLKILLKYDFYGKDINLMEKLSGRNDALPFSSILLMVTVSVVLYAVLTWYLEEVNPGKYGVPRTYNFCFKKSYWFPKKVVASSSNSVQNTTPNNFEPVSEYLKPGVCIKNVTKVYKSSAKGVVTAVDDVSLDFYYQEISGLLGHNGAGKSTLLSMITGMIYPTSGRIKINGFDLGINTRKARQSFGFCPQHDLLFGDLTTLQTITFYGAVKSLKPEEAQKEAIGLIKKLNLTNVRNCQVCKLSGGQKRKVSLAIALIGGSEVLVLDEPTAGMDPEIRREIWEILLSLRSGRTILLTTHFMEEADALCDRIAIMNHGKIKCFGTPMYLKSRYGKGYVLSIVVPHEDKSHTISDFVSMFIPSAKFKSQNIRTLNFELPESQVSVFPAFFCGLDKMQREGEITSYSISLSTLEDVFLRLRSAHEEKDEFDIVDSPSFIKLDTANKERSLKPSNFIVFNQLWALILKKWIFFQRSYKLFLMYSVFPIVFIILMEIFSREYPAKTDFRFAKSLTYSLDLYPSSLVLYLMSGYGKTLFQNLVQTSGSEAVQVNDTANSIEKIYDDDFYTYAKKLILAVEISQEHFKVYHNHDAVHMVPISLNLIHNYLLKYSYQDGAIVTSINISYVNKELSILPKENSKCRVRNLPDTAGTQSFFFLAGPVKELFHGAKRLQMMMTWVPVYWLSHLLFDACLFFLYQMVLFTSVGAALDDRMLLFPPVEIVLGFFLWGVGLILFQYVIASSIKKMSGAFTASIITYIIFTYVIYNLVSLDGPFCFLRLLHPTRFLDTGLSDYCSGQKSFFVMRLFCYDCALFACLLIKDTESVTEIAYYLINRLFKIKYSSKVDEDELVKEEEERTEALIRGKDLSEHNLIVHDIRRWFIKNCRISVAVQGISFAVNKGECFGLLGVNGAGKTTTFRILTGEIPASHGSIYACSERLALGYKQKYLFSIGYCPQFGGLIPSFKGKEILELFGRLKGIPGSVIKQEVHKWLDKMSILEYANQYCGTYSGGNQRKLSTAIALIGNSPLIFLDEPTTGVDPLSRRSIWNVIEEVQKEGQSIVLTSHSMDECEALCSRLAIMVKGRFRCLGETATLKNKFGGGYTIQLKLSNNVAKHEVNSLKEYIIEKFGRSFKLVDDHITILQYHVEDEFLTWANLFRMLNNLKEDFSILESYTASATTLERIFIYFARNECERNFTEAV